MNNPLKDIIANEIRGSGAISFYRFMQLALYHPEFGYYENNGRTIGKQGDFYTSVSTGELFGELLGFRFARWCEGSETFQILEAGAHHGQLAKDILNYFRTFRPDLFSRLEYVILEPSNRRAEQQRKILSEFPGRMRWVNDWKSLPYGSVNGVIFSNELLDAFPVHRLRWNAQSKQWHESGVGLENDELVPVKMDSDPRILRDFFKFNFQSGSMPENLAAALPENFLTEFSPDATAWWKQASDRLRRGRLLTLDYGLETSQIFTPERSPGTLRAYRNHRLSENLLDHAGDQDITASVNFSNLIDQGEDSDLITEQFVAQESFLAGLLKQIEEDPICFPDWTPERLRQLKTLIHPDHLGRAFKVLLQRRS